MNLIRGYDYEISFPQKVVVATFKHVTINFLGQISLVFQYEGRELEVVMKCKQISTTCYEPCLPYEIKELSSASK
ncbi:hypothetical protein VF14_03440 [Nostoc linckia z18]|uniref:Uncharacterized protein n=2 Tax=Nostoc linckia TaxID=92942 RepID=A0A9Q5ZGL5_NOSLI|nr:hypothetical protein VF02_00910 [Nostoc linckia z1]PHJ73350.1 hypothetical protein VF05_01925 [Nostoc linckia z3]PHJ78697.1 hypothetical protein VF03_00910 [Nostoc linckia z2]PHJ85801.1 hypothetical protein VF06_06230 [Nostoc linckia z4]PHJ92303.1 hypothetical protein VF07_02215 [Nostoc linckia z6]PHK01307.1 hypothetical protein VF04_00910 [Nostoc linckia z7]PHK07218.1 hypothetical protein VF08_01040 [Nostoc linckia z8]PHK12955.1 hypothetical protein VF09_01125 [Nostoc linckia z9]PHK2358